MAVAIGSSLVVPSAVASEETNSTPSATETIQVYGHQYEGYAEHMPQSGTKTDVEWLDVPQAVSVVTKTEMQDRGAVRLVDALDGVAGVNNTLGEGSRDQFMIRGFDSLNDMYRDGMRDDGTLQSYRSLANVERVEIVKGPAGALYGRGSAGGIINLVTKRANGDNFTHVKAVWAATASMLVKSTAQWHFLTRSTDVLTWNTVRPILTSIMLIRTISSSRRPFACCQRTVTRLILTLNTPIKN